MTFITRAVYETAAIWVYVPLGVFVVAGVWTLSLLERRASARGAARRAQMRKPQPCQAGAPSANRRLRLRDNDKCS